MGEFQPACKLEVLQLLTKACTFSKQQQKRNVRVSKLHAFYLHWNASALIMCPYPVFQLCGGLGAELYLQHKVTNFPTVFNNPPLKGIFFEVELGLGL